MKIQLSKSQPKEIIKDTYQIIVKTMTGDADDYHSFSVSTKSEDELRNMLIHLNILMKCNPYGDCYPQCYYETYFDGMLFYNCLNDAWDYLKEYKVMYFDNDGIVHKVKITFDDEMLAEIKNPPKMTKELLKQYEYNKR